MKTPDVIVIGSGLAGTSAAYSFAKRGASVLIIEKASAIASGASGNPLGIIVPYYTNSDTVPGRFYGAAYRSILSHIEELQRFERCASFRNTGALQLPSTPRLKNLIDRARESRSEQYMSAADASRKAGVAFSHDCIFHASAGIVSPPELCDSNLASFSERISLRLACRAERLLRESNTWKIFDETGTRIAEAQTVVIAGAYESSRFNETSWLPLEPIRGQLLYLPENIETKPLKIPVCFDGYFLPSIEGMHVVGAGYDHGLFDGDLLPEKQIDMARRVSKWFPHIKISNPGKLAGRVSFRTSTHDRIPYIGAVPNRETGEDFEGLFISAGHGSRGLLSSCLGGEVIAALADGESLLNPDEIAGISPRRVVETWVSYRNRASYRNLER